MRTKRAGRGSMCAAVRACRCRTSQLSHVSSGCAAHSGVAAAHCTISFVIILKDYGFTLYTPNIRCIQKTLRAYTAAGRARATARHGTTIFIHTISCATRVIYRSRRRVRMRSTPQPTSTLHAIALSSRFPSLPHTYSLPPTVGSPPERLEVKAVPTLLSARTTTTTRPFASELTHACWRVAPLS